jgi:hypothetical protein
MLSPPEGFKKESYFVLQLWIQILKSFFWLNPVCRCRIKSTAKKYGQSYEVFLGKKKLI